MHTRAETFRLCVRLVLTGCIWAGLFGMLHNQLSCTLSPEYFTEFKFVQFGLPQGTPLRLGAAWVGWGASWWVGGMVAVGLLYWQMVHLRTPVDAGTNYRAFLTELLVTFLSGQLGLLVAEVLLRMGIFDNLQSPLLANFTATQRAAFIRVGVMHDASYLGGLVGLLIAAWRLRNSLSRLSTSAAANPVESGE